MEMKKVDILLSAAVYAVYMILSCIVIMFAEILAVKIVNLFIVTDYLSLCIIRAAVYFLGVSAILAVVAYKEGYKSACFSIPSFLISALLAAVVHFIFSFLFSFQAFASGSVRYIAALVKFGDALNSNTFMGSLDRVDFIPYFAVISLFYIAIMMVCGKIGEHRRINDRKGLKGIDPDMKD